MIFQIIHPLSDHLKIRHICLIVYEQFHAEKMKNVPILLRFFQYRIEQEKISTFLEYKHVEKVIFRPEI